MFFELQLKYETSYSFFQVHSRSRPLYFHHLHGSYRCKNICKVFHLYRIVTDVHLVFLRLCNFCLNYILWAYVLVLYIFTNVSQACLGDFASLICTIMESDTLMKNQYKTLFVFSCQVLLA